ncbi:orotate phosphoribosyltransferase [Fructobacillus fructosus]|uniref:orotate phosphoribosyltransferase n=1 Tax=Fructobacillus fructosus TaxID=1631 RepID=UPI002D843436|nr:Orotate phosphoribosyltransferase (PyrE) [Fructobacillus fructosus]CAK1247444.1 Orotate phosphoribosyltransferase (PyrE) [Fructobacillus fructosus]CAK1248256.1 Orotate phosphoribosyltransferase (PyrE) [Fructobacillus fructosus]
MTLQETIINDLIDEDIVKFKEEGHFTFASGIQSPIYTDLRQTISFPKTRRAITQALAKLVTTHYPETTVIAGVATAGIPQAALVAEELDLPMVYVRSKPKDHGTKSQIEGVIRKDDRVLLIDDLISTGGSVLKAAKAVLAADYQVSGVLSIFSYGFPDAEQNFAEAGLTFESVITYSALLSSYQKRTGLSVEKVASFQSWHENPWNWQG